MDPARLVKACAGKSRSQGGYNVSDLKKFYGADASKLTRPQLLKKLCAKAATKSATKSATATKPTPTTKPATKPATTKSATKPAPATKPATKPAMKPVVDQRLIKACAGKSYSQGGYNLSHIRNICRERGLSCSGDKAGLLKRLCEQKQKSEPEVHSRKLSGPEDYQCDIDTTGAIIPKPEEYKTVVQDFMSQCYSIQCDTVRAVNTITTGVLTIPATKRRRRRGGTKERKYVLPDINPFRYISEVRLVSSFPYDEHVVNNLVDIADMLMKKTDDDTIRAIKQCIDLSLKERQIAYLVYAAGLVDMYLWKDMKKYFPFRRAWAGGEILNFEQPQKCLNQWVLLDMFCKKHFMVSIYMVWNLPYRASSSSPYISSYYDKEQLVQNCIFSTLMEGAIAQERGVKIEDIVVRVQRPNRDQAQYHGMASIKREDLNKGVHWASEIKGEQMRVINTMPTCTLKGLSYATDHRDIIMSILYGLIGIYKATLWHMKVDQKRPKTEIMDLYGKVRRAGKLFYHLRAHLETTSTAEIQKDYHTDTLRDHNAHSAYGLKLGAFKEIDNMYKPF